MEPESSLPYSQEYFVTVLFHGEELLAPRPTPKLEDHPLSAVQTAYSVYSELPSISEAVPPSRRLCPVTEMCVFLGTALFPRLNAPYMETPHHTNLPSMTGKMAYVLRAINECHRCRFLPYGAVRTCTERPCTGHSSVSEAGGRRRTVQKLALPLLPLS